MPKTNNVGSDNYFSIQGWMITDLHLKGNDLLVYAIIYGFSQTKNQKFTGSLQYLADWCSCTKQGIQKNLKNLIDRGLIIKHDIEVKGIKLCEYEAVDRNSVTYTTELHTIQLSCTNNIDNINISSDILKKDITNVISSDEPIKTDTFFDTPSLIAKPKKKKVSLYEGCMLLIDEFTQDEEVRNKLKEYFKVRLERKDIPLGKASFKGSLNKLRELTTSKKEVLQIIQQSIDRSYPSFYPLNKPRYTREYTCPEIISAGEKREITDEEYEEAMLNGEKF